MNARAAEPGRQSRQRSSLRIAANRRNALKSTGPRTAAGKRRVALNALVRGLLPEDLERQLRARGEDLNEFRRLHRDLIGIFEPRDPVGARVVTQMTLTWWEKARRIRQWVAAGPPRSDDLDARLEALLVLMVTVLRGRHEWWAHRLAGVVGRRVGSPNEVRRQIEQRLYAFGARKRNRKYPRIDRGEAKAEELSPKLTNYVERALESILAESGIKSQGPEAGVTC